MKRQPAVGHDFISVAYDPSVKRGGNKNRVTKTRRSRQKLLSPGGTGAAPGQSAQVPTLILQSEASYHAGYDQCSVRFLRQAGVSVDFIKLEDVGIRGNGHMMMLEKNNHEIAQVMIDWLEKSVK